MKREWLNLRPGHCDPVVFDIVLLYLSAAWGSDALVCLGTTLKKKNE